MKHCLGYRYRADLAGELPLSFAEARLWFLDQLLPEKSVYNVPELVKVEGELDIEVLRRAVDALVDRHESLRTGFSDVDGRPLRQIAPSANVEIEVVNLAGSNVEDREGEAYAIAREKAGRPFDLARAPLLRLSIFPVAAREHLILLVMHHIVTDGWSMGVLTRELAALYGAIRTGQKSELPEMAVQYVDFAAWEKRWASEGGLASQLEYWRKRLASPTALELPTDHPRPRCGYRGATEAFRFRRGRGSARPLLEHGRATLFMALLAAFDVLMFRYSHQDDVAVGSVVANRRRHETEGLIGFFVNTLVMRTDLSGDPSFAELIDRVRETALDAYAHQEVPFEKLVEELRPERDRSRTPFFQVLFVLQNAPLSLAFDELRLEPIAIDTGTSKFDLSWFLTEQHGGSIGGSVEYSTDLYEAATIRRIVGHYLTLLRAAAADPAQPISALQLLTPSENRQLLVEWNQTATDFPRELGLHQLFEQQAASHPDDDVVLFGDERVGYRTLNLKANQLAHYLHARRGAWRRSESVSNVRRT